MITNDRRSLAPRVLAAALIFVVLLVAAASTATAQGPYPPYNNQPNPAPPVVNQQPNATFVYIVRSGDTLFSLARRYATTVNELVQLNGISNPNIIFAGQRLIIPGAGTPPTPGPAPAPILYIVRPGDNLFRLSIRFGVPMISIVVANHIPNPNLIFAGQRLLIPVGVVPAPGATSTPQAAPTVLPTGSAPVVITMMNNSYSPNTVSVSAGTTVRWMNNETSAVPHTVTSGSPNAPSGLFDSGNLNPGQTFDFTFNTPGTYTYYCRIHGAAMTGTITVTP